MQIKSYEEAIRYLEGFIGKVIFKVDKATLKHYDPLERMRTLLSLLDNPQNRFQSVLVGGTSGKGSTSYLISHILTTAGYKTGLTLSPHLQKVNERLQINGEQISDTKFTDLVNFITQIITQMKKMSVGAPSYFEILIAMAFKYFADQKVDIAVVEVGMGGEFDATNTLYPLIAVLTNVSLDHTNVLGRTVEKIARTKVGIVKGSVHSLGDLVVPRGPAARSSHPTSSKKMSSGLRPAIFLRALDGTPSARVTPRLVVVTGVEQKSVIKIIQERCREQGAKFFLLNKDFDYKVNKESRIWTEFDFQSKVVNLKNLHLSLLGQYQVENASLAIKAALELRKFGFEASEENVRKALESAFFPGRFEYILHNTKYKIVLDGAHNPIKMKKFLESLKKLFPKNKKIFVIGFKFDKDVKKMLGQILKAADKLIVTEFRAKTDMKLNAGMDVKSIKYYVSGANYSGGVYWEENLKRAMGEAFKIAEKDDLIVVTGSLYLVGEVRDML